MTHDVDVAIEYILTAKFVYKGISVQLKTGPVEGYESAKSVLLELVKEARRGIDDAATKAESDRTAGFRHEDGDPASDR